MHRKDLKFRRLAIATTAVVIAILVVTTGMGLLENEHSSSGLQGSRPLDGIAFSPTEINSSNNGSTVMTVHVSIRIGSDIEENAPFENVYLCAYDRNVDIIESINLGTLPENWHSYVNVRTNELPYYSFIHHPEFRGLQGEYQMLKYNDEYDLWMSSGVNELPFEFDEMSWTGCRPPSSL